MIIVFPMLCSNSLSHQTLPAIAKTVEKYLIVHELDKILEQTKRQASSARVSKGRLQIKEDTTISSSIGEGFVVLDEQDHQPGTKTSDNSRKQKEEKAEMEKEKLKQQAEYYKQQIENLKSKKEQMEGEEKQKLEQQIENLKGEYEKTQKQIEVQNQQLEKLKKEKQKLAQTAVTGVSIPRNIGSLEPTYMEVDRIVDGKQVKDIVGVKVMPYRVNAKESESLVTLLMYDRNLTKIEKSVTSLGRKFKRKLLNMYDNVKKKTIGKLMSGGEPVSGDPRRDVIMARTSFKGNIFVCADASEMDDEFFANIGGVKSLFNLGWPSIIAVDEVEKSASFCMQGYQGICYNVSFSRMFKMMGDDEGKVYEDMSSVKKSAGGLFRQKSKPKKVFGESFAYGVLDDYKTHINEYKQNKVQKKDNYIDESIKEILNEGKIRDAWNYIGKIKNIGKVIKSGDIKKLNSYFKGRGDIRKIREKGKLVNPKFDDCYRVAKKRIDKFAPDINDKIKQAFASSVATASGSEPDRPVKYAEKLSDGSIKAINRWYSNLERKQEIPSGKSDRITGAIIISIVLVIILSFSGALMYGVIRGAMILSTGTDMPTDGGISSDISSLPQSEPTSPSATKSTVPGTPDASSKAGFSGQVPDLKPRSGVSLSMGPAAILINLANEPDSVETARAASQQLKDSGGILQSISNIWDLLGSIVMLVWDVIGTIINLVSTIVASLISLTEHLLTPQGVAQLFKDPSTIFDIFKYRDVIPTFYY